MHERTKKLAISSAVRAAVYERDSWDNTPCCILCGSTYQLELAHVRSRAQGGLGVERNLVTLCSTDHRRMDQSGERQELLAQVKEYLMWRYPDWDETELQYKGSDNKAAL